LRLDFLPILIACFALSSTAQAVGPDTGGAIPGANNGEGIGALVSLTSGGWNTGTGYLSLKEQHHRSFNTATGGGSLFFNADGERNTATGAGALFHNTDGTDNTATGAFALFDNIRIGDVVGYSNTATGVEALGSNLSGYENTATGVNALVGNTYGVRNTAAGVEALLSNVIGNYNTADGFRALHSNTSGSFNTAIGDETLYNNTWGGGNVALGNAAGLNVTTANNVICIGTGIQGANVSDTCFIGNIFGVTTGLDAASVVVDANGQLGTVASSRRFKKEIKPMDHASESILALKPVTFHYESDAKGRPQFGLIAEEVAEVNPDLVVRDKNGEIYTVRYDAVNAMLLNEFLKEHRTMQEQQKEINGLKAELKQQRALIQKVSAQIQVSKPSLRTVLNDQ